MQDSYYKIIWYGDECGGKIIEMKCGYPGAREKSVEKVEKNGGDKETEFKERLKNSISRTKNRIFEIAACNDFQWFFTGTLNPNWHDSGNLGEFRKKFTQMIRDFRKKTGCDVRYLLIPEQHKSGAWHMHGLLGGLPVEMLHKFSIVEHLPHKILNRVKEYDDVYNWEEYSRKFGFTTLTPIHDKAATTAYITKYITKDCYSSAISNNNHMYYCSCGLKKATILYEGYKNTGDGFGSISWDYENEYVKIKSIKAEELLKLYVY